MILDLPKTKKNNFKKGLFLWMTELFLSARFHLFCFKICHFCCFFPNTYPDLHHLQGGMKLAKQISPLLNYLIIFRYFCLVKQRLMVIDFRPNSWSRSERRIQSAELVKSNWTKCHTILCKRRNLLFYNYYDYHHYYNF